MKELCRVIYDIIIVTSTTANEKEPFIVTLSAINILCESIPWHQIQITINEAATEALAETKPIRFER